MRNEQTTIHAENSLAGAILIEPYAVIEAVRGIVSPDDFLSHRAKEVFVATLRLVDSGKPCDATLIQAEADEECSIEYCAEVMKMTPTTTNSGEYAKIIHEAAQERRASTIGFKLASGELSPLEGTRELQELLNNQTSTVLTPAQAAQIVMNNINEAAQGKAKPYIETGFKNLDSLLTGGLPAGGLCTVAARPGTGKTTFALSIAEHIASMGQTVLYFSLEMTLQQLWTCRIASCSGLNRGTIYSGNFGETDSGSWKRITDALSILAERPFYIRDEPASIEDIESVARCTSGLRLVVIDHIGLLRSPVNGSRYEIMTDTAHRLKQLALSLKIPILALCQLNRNAVSRESKKPSMADLRDSGAIEEDSDNVMLLFREAEYLPEEERPRSWEWQSIDVIVDKNRHGRTGIVGLQTNLSIAAVRD